MASRPRLIGLDEADPKIVAEVTGRKPAYDFGGEFKTKIASRLKPRDLDGIRMLPTHALVALYIREKVSQSLYAAAPTQNEDHWQGKVGLVLRLGGGAFEDSGTLSFGGFKATVGEFVLFRNTDGWDFAIVPQGGVEQVLCKLIPDEDIKAVIPRPEMVY